MPLPPPPPPKQKPEKPHKPPKPTRTQLQQRFVNYWTNHGYGNLEPMWGDIQDIAKSHGLDPVYLAAYLMSHGGVGTDYAYIQGKADAEAKRLGRTKGRDQRTGAIIDRTPGINDKPRNAYKFVMGGTWGAAQRTKDEKKKFDTSINNPTIFKDRYGYPVTKQDYQQDVAGLNDLFQKYVGRNVTKREAINIIKNHWSDYKIETYLTKRPGFTKGQVWKSQAPLLVSDWETVYGVDATLKAPKELIRQAILRGAGGSAWFQDQIRKLPQYKKSVEYKQFFAGYSQTYNTIMGQVDKAGESFIDEAITKRMSAEEFTSLLRKRPEYANSLEQRSEMDKWRSWFGLGSSEPWDAPAAQQPSTTQPPSQQPTPPAQPPKKPPKRPGGRPSYGQIPVNARSGI